MSCLSEPNNIQANSTKINNNITNNLSKQASYEYQVAIERNMGVFSESDQDNIRKARIVVVGTGGIGGTISIILARTGVSNFMLIDPDRYEPTNMNRQVSCFTDTIGKYKVEVLKRDILRINPEARVETHNRSLSFEEIKDLIKDWDVVVAEADDLAYSSKVLYMAQEMKKFAATAMPSGYLGYVMSFPPNRKPIPPETLFGLPDNLSYEELHQLIESWENKCGRRWYLSEGKWRIKWFRDWRAGEKGLTQICSGVWLCASLAATEIIKFITGKFRVVEAPRTWHVKLADNRIKVEPFTIYHRLFNKYALKAFGIKTLNIGRRWRESALRIFDWQLSKAEENEKKMDEEVASRMQERRKLLG